MEKYSNVIKELQHHLTLMQAYYRANVVKMNPQERAQFTNDEETVIAALTYFRLRAKVGQRP